MPKEKDNTEEILDLQEDVDKLKAAHKALYEFCDDLRNQMRYHDGYDLPKIENPFKEDNND